MCEIKVHEAPLAFHAVAFDFKDKFPAGDAFKEEFSNIIHGRKLNGSVTPLLSGVVHCKYNSSCYKIILFVQDGPKKLHEKVCKIQELKPWGDSLNRVYIPADTKIRPPSA